MHTVDFQRSFLTFRVDLLAQAAITLSHRPPTTENNARIQLESVCHITKRSTAERTTYVLGASCKTERVGAPSDLWLSPNADFCPIVSEDEFLIIKSWEKRGMGVLRNPPSLGVQSERQSGAVKEAWTRLNITICPVEARPLQDITAITEAIFDNTPIVCQTEYSEGDFDINLIHPVKTINVSMREAVFQTDTGPVLLPDLGPRPVERFIERFDLAYSALNSGDWAEFVINTPVPLAAGIEVNHYARTRRIEGVRNSLLAPAQGPGA
jgi:hypothetical protein